MTLCWLTDDPEVCSAVVSWLEGRPEAEVSVLADSARRQLVRLDLGSGRSIRAKRFKRVARTRFIDWLKAAVGFAPEQREWRALCRLHAAGLPVPRPLGRSGPREGNGLLITEFVEGRPLSEGLRADPTTRRRWWTQLGTLLRAMHAEGFTHGDLHTGNVIVSEEGPVLLDLQRCRRRRSARARIRELGRFDFSLAQNGFSRADRLRVRMAALAPAEARAASVRRALRAVGRAAERRARHYYASRTGRSQRPGRRFARIKNAAGLGLRCVDFPEAAVEEALAAHAAAQLRGGDPVLKQDHRARVSSVSVAGRALVVKEVTKRGLARRLADALRGSPARRGWTGGHGLLARGIGAARPLAFVERRRLGIPLSSALILEDLRPARPASQIVPGEIDGEQLVEALDRLVRRLHQTRVLHGDFQCLHIFVSKDEHGLRTALIDLEGVRFRRRLSDRQRIQTLAELNASLPRALAPAGSRRRAFERYARALPFRAGPKRALARIIERSLARRQAWDAADCARARTIREDPQRLSRVRGSR